MRTFLLAVLAYGIEAHAIRGSVVDWPIGKNNARLFSKASGLRATLDSRWFPEGGYLPVRLRVDAKAPSIVDRRLEITLHLLSASNRRFQRSRDPGDALFTVRRELTLAAGETEASTTMLCPSVGLSDTLSVRIAVDGVEDPQLTSSTALVSSGMQRGGGLRVLRPLEADLVRMVSEQWLALGSRRNKWVAINELTTQSQDNWIAYSASDVIATDLASLEQLANKEQAKIDAVRRWLLAGGVLWIELAEPGGVETMEAATLAKIDRLLGLQRWRFAAVGEESQRLPDQDDEDEEAEAPSGDITRDSEKPAAVEPEGEDDEMPSSGSLREPPTIPIDGTPGWGYVAVPRANGAAMPTGRLLDGEFRFDQLLRRLQTASARDSRAWFAQREAGFGRVLAFRDSAQSIPEVLRSPAGASLIESWRRRDWTQRHGLEVGGKNSEFGNLLIPGVGVAPVNEFQVLITLFVLLVGPLNYWLLWRQRQLHLLVITAPLGALAVTLGLVAYAAVSDGFGVKARVRSATLLDQTTGEAASWSRVTHYAATAPAEPAVIPSDTAIYPINPAWQGAFNAASVGRTLDWTPDGQSLTTGWFPTRTAVQHLLVRSRATEARLEILDPDNPAKVVNRLGAAIKLLLLRDDSGEWLIAEEMSADGEAALQPITYQKASLKYRLLAVDNEPAFPLGAGKAIEQTLDRLGRSSDVRRMQRSLSPTQLQTNLMNGVLDRLAGVTGDPTLDVPPRTYIAVTNQAVETPLGWERVQEVGSFHVIVGRW